jgi:hypothetical protein
VSVSAKDVAGRHRGTRQTEETPGAHPAARLLERAVFGALTRASCLRRTYSSELS